VSEWFARPVLFVADIGRSVDFYVNQLGFTQSWRHEEEGKALVAQVDRKAARSSCPRSGRTKWAAL
jgi:catechol 2,3-dioxygenase-like lactoylglutathione lyase family enzyme